MKALDRYITRELMVPILYSSLILVFLILISDLFNNLDDLIHNHTPLRIILHYYLMLAPYSFVQTIPWAAWIGTLFLLINLGLHNEIVAMKSAGLKISTITAPILFFGFLIGIATFLISDRLVPPTLRKAREIKSTYIEKKKEHTGEKLAHNVTYYSGDQLYYFRSFSKIKNEVEGVVVLWLGKNDQPTRQKMIARQGAWDGKGWTFDSVTEYQMDSRGRILGEPKTFPKKVYPEINFQPSELIIASSESPFLTYRELKRSIEKLKENNVTVYSENVDLHYRLASPWQALVMMMIAIPLLTRTATRKLIAANVLFCIGLIFIYHVSGAIGLALGKAGKIFPFLSAWSGNIIFSAGALFHLEKGNY